MTRGAGFFRELSYGDTDAPSILDSVGRLTRADKERVLRYLAGGAAVETLLLVTTDVLDDNHPPIGGLELRTDGEWLWPSDLAYYVELYDCAVPRDFYEHMAANDWEPPAAGEIDTDAVRASVDRDYDEESDNV